MRHLHWITTIAATVGAVGTAYLCGANAETLLMAGCLSAVAVEMFKTMAWRLVD